MFSLGILTNEISEKRLVQALIFVKKLYGIRVNKFPNYGCKNAKNSLVLGFFQPVVLGTGLWSCKYLQFKAGFDNLELPQEI